MIRVYTLPAGSNQVGQWTEIAAAVFTSASADAVELAFTPPPTNESGDELFAFYREISGSGGPVLMQRSTRDLTNWNWSPATSMGQTSREYAGASAAAVYDGRVVAAGAEGLRAFRNTHRGCDGQATTCNDSGYHPGILVDELTCDSLYCVDTPPTCTGGAGELGCACNSTQCDPGLRCAVLGGNTLCVDAAIQTYIQYAPFAEGHNPTEYCDYNDWDQIAWFMCEGLANRSAPTSAPLGVPYQLTTTPGDPANVRCGNRPVFAEPTSSGVCAPSYSTILSDRSLFPEYY